MFERIYTLSRSTYLCWDCVRERCRVIRTKAKIQEDSKVIAEILKVKDLDTDPTDSFWVGKTSLRSWKKLVHEELEKSTRTNGGKPVDESPVSESVSNSAETIELDTDIPSSLGSLDSAGLENSPGPSTSQSQRTTNDFKFNEDLFCEEHSE